ncbi:hypothetical protein ACJX0J_007798, partial [Zea mays]
ATIGVQLLYYRTNLLCGVELGTVKNMDESLMLYCRNHGIYYFFLIQNLFHQIWLNITQENDFASSTREEVEHVEFATKGLKIDLEKNDHFVILWDLFGKTSLLFLVRI